jgi:hypothetical protein
VLEQTEPIMSRQLGAANRARNFAPGSGPAAGN